MTRARERADEQLMGHPLFNRSVTVASVSAVIIAGVGAAVLAWSAWRFIIGLIG